MSDARPMSEWFMPRYRSKATGSGHNIFTSNPVPITTKFLRVNGLIRIPQVTLIDETGKSVGIIPTSEALRMAQDRGYDLVEVAPHAQPPVCKLLDYGAYQYRIEKQERKAKAHQKKIELKGVRISFKIGDHDRNVRLETAKKFLNEGHKVKIEMILRGREFAHQDRARDNVRQFIGDLGEGIVVEQALGKLGNKLSCVIMKTSK
ncbi:MAG: translation initiation factor IF-3 [Candidatus Kerfeldbacteria bacterium]